MMSFGEYLLYETDPRLVQKYTEKPGPGLSARKPTVTTGKASATRHTGPTAFSQSSGPGSDERVLSKLRASRFVARSRSLKNRAAIKKRSAILAKGPKRRK